jgi:conjugative transposon TraM protein
MTQSQNKTPDDKSDVEQRESDQQSKRKAKWKERLKFYGFVALLTVMCLVFIWFIFKLDEAQDTERADGLNYSIPEASLPDTEGDKRKALEQAEMEDKRQGRTRSPIDFGEMFGQSEFKYDAPDSIAEPMPDASDDPIRESRQTALRLNEQLMTFYDKPAEDPQVAELKRQVAELTEQVRSQQSSGVAAQTVDEMALLEKSFEMASRYMPEQTTTAGQAQATPEPQRDIAAVRRADDNPVSSLATLDLTEQERNFGFATAVGQGTVAVSNAIRACIDQDQTVTAGAQVCLRLLEPLKVGGYLIPVNAPVYGNARIEGQRLSVVVTSIESEGNIIPVEMTVHDMDGQAGLNVPGSMERTAAKEALASIGQGAGTSVSFARDAKQQIAMDLTSGVMNGASQYLAAKMREVKINLKAGYRVLLIAKQ